jgi:excisionase family DNA binding protein
MASEKWTLTVQEAAALLGISTNLAYDLCHEGKIPSIKLGQKRILIPRVQLLKLLAGEVPK